MYNGVWKIHIFFSSSWGEVDMENGKTCRGYVPRIACSISFQVYPGPPDVQLPVLYTRFQNDMNPLAGSPTSGNVFRLGSIFTVYEALLILQP
jgi:hypothetical protein